MQGKERIAFRRPQEILSYAANAPKTINLHEGRVYRSLMCRVSGTLNIGTAAATGVKEDAVQALLKQLEVMVNGNVPIKTLTGKALYELTSLRNRVLAYVVQPGTAIGDHPFELFFEVPFWMPEAGIAMDSTLVDATRKGGVTAFTLQATWGDAEDMVTPDATTVLSWTVEPTIEVISHDLVRDDSAQNNYGIHRERTILMDVKGTNDRMLVDLLSGPNRKVLSALIITRDGGVRSDGILNNVSIESDSDVRYKMSASMIKRLTDARFERAQGDNRTGVYFIDIAPRNLIGHGAEMSAVSSFNGVLDVADLGNSQIEIVVQEIIGANSDSVK